MMWTIEVDATEFLTALDRVVDYVRDHAAEDAARVTLPAIVQTTQSGKSPDGESYVPYKPKYKKRREKLGLQTDHVDLTVTGEMLGSLKYDADSKSIMPSDEAGPRARGHQFGYAGSNLPKRPFLGASEDTKVEIHDTLSRGVETAYYGTENTH